MGIVNSIIDFVFPIQRRLYHSTGRFIRNPRRFRSPLVQRRFARSRLWPRGAISPRRLSTAPHSSIQFRRPLAKTITPVLAPLPKVTQKKSFWSEMFSPNITPPRMQPQSKRSGFGSTALNLMRWNNMFRR